MSHVSNTTTIPVTQQIRTHWVVALSALLALLATAAVVLVLVIDGGSSPTGGSVAESVGSHPSGAAPPVLPRAVPDNPAYDAAVAEAIGARTSAGPDESKIGGPIDPR
jgi:hypothetical protein